MFVASCTVLLIKKFFRSQYYQEKEKLFSTCFSIFESTNKVSYKVYYKICSPNIGRCLLLRIGWKLRRKIRIQVFTRQIIEFESFEIPIFKWCRMKIDNQKAFWESIYLLNFSKFRWTSGKWTYCGLRTQRLRNIGKIKCLRINNL